MYDLLPFILIIAALAVMLVIIVRRFPQLTLIDVDNLPEVQQERKKDEYLKKRVKSRAKQKAKKIDISGIIDWWKQKQLDFRKYVGGVEKKLVARQEAKRKQEPVSKQVDRKQQVAELLKQAEQQADGGDIEKAEAQYIAVIRLDAKNTEAYYGLAGVYKKKGELTEAAQTCEYLLQLDPNNDLAAVRMAEIAEKQGNTLKAIEYYQQAVLITDMYPNRFDKLAHMLQSEGQLDAALEAAAQAADLEPENPKYLDNLLELAILVADKDLAEEVYSRLRLVNPENQKLRSFRQRVDEIA